MMARGLHSTMNSLFSVNPGASGSNLGVSKNFSNVAEFNSGTCCLESGLQRLKNVDRSHLVQGSQWQSRLVLRKKDG